MSLSECMKMTEGEDKRMRTYGRILKNIAAVATLLALLSLLLPFCRVPADGQNLVLSGMDVIKAGARAGYTYFTTESIPDTFVLKTPVTVGTLKSALSYVQGAGLTRILLVCAVAVLLLVLLAFFSMCMLLLAEGKKTMVFPTLFTAMIVLELAVVFVGFPALKLFFLKGVYLFAILVVIAMVCIMAGWITGGYRRPKQEDGSERPAREASNKENRFGRKRRKRTFHRRKKFGKKKKKSSRKSRGNKDSGKDNAKQQTAEGAKRMEWKECEISYDPSTHMYRINNTGENQILLLKDEQIVGIVEPNARVRIERPVMLQVKETKESLQLK